MPYPSTRSMNAEMNEGSTDGKYKKVIQDRGGSVESGTYDDRRILDDAWHGIHEAPAKINPGTGRAVRTPNFVSTPPAENDF